MKSVENRTAAIYQLHALTARGGHMFHFMASMTIAGVVYFGYSLTQHGFYFTVGFKKHSKSLLAVQFSVFLFTPMSLTLSSTTLNSFSCSELTFVSPRTRLCSIFTCTVCDFSRFCLICANLVSRSWSEIRTAILISFITD